MRFGLTAKEKEIRFKLKLVNQAIGRYRIAWWPTRIHDGSWIWFEGYYWIKHTYVYKDYDGKYNTQHFYGCDEYAFMLRSKANWQCGIKSKSNHHAYGTHTYIYGEEALNMLTEYREELYALLEEC